MQRELLTILTLGASFAAFAASAGAQETGSDTVDSLLACKEITESEARLACLDANLASVSAAISDGRIIIVEREAVRAVERESFGLSLPSVAGLGGLLGRSGGQEAEAAEAEAATESETLEDGAIVVYRQSGGIDELRGAPVRRVDTDPFGKFVVELENGQVWVQTDSARVMAVRRRHMEGLTADIERGLFGSYAMRLSHSGPSFRVERRR